MKEFSLYEVSSIVSPVTSESDSSEISSSEESNDNESISDNCYCCDHKLNFIPTVLHTDYHKLVVIGGGPQALALVARYKEPLPAEIYTDLEHSRLSFLRRNKFVQKAKGLKRTLGPNSSSNSSRENFSTPSESESESESKSSNEGIKIFDSTSSKWMSKWDNYFSKLNITHLRSPLFFHPSPRDVDALVSFAHREGRKDELVEICGVVGKEGSKHSRKKKMNPLSSHTIPKLNSQVSLINERSRQDYHNPSTSLFSNFCQSDLISHYSVSSLISNENVTSLNYQKIHVIGEGVKDAFYLESRDMDGGVKYCAAEAVVLAVGQGGKMNLPEFLMEESDSLGKDDDDDDGNRKEKKKEKREKEKEYWCHSSKFSEPAFEFPSKKLEEKNSRGEEVTMVVIGGGLTSAQIVELALSKGVTKVILICRHQLKVSQFDFPLPWISKYANLLKHSFFNESSPLAKLRIIKEAKGGGSITHSWMKLLKSRIKDGRLEILEGVRIERGVWEEERGWKLELKRVGDDSKSLWGEERKFEGIDYLVCSTGFKMDFKSLPFLSPSTSSTLSSSSKFIEMESRLFQDHPLEVINGLPILTEDLQWNSKIPLFVIGAYALLQLGPDALNLGGARNGAERIVSRLQELERLKDSDSDVNVDRIIEIGRKERRGRGEREVMALGEGNYFAIFGREDGVEIEIEVEIE